MYSPRRAIKWNYHALKQRSHGKKIVSAVVAQIFLFTQFSFALPSTVNSGISSDAPAVIPISSNLISNPSLLRIPSSFASLKEVHEGSNGKLIIHIQDAHANYDGQMNLANSLDFFMKHYDLNTALVEGGDRDVSLDRVREIAGEKTWKIVGKKYLFEGLITGPEYLNLINDRPMNLLGVEYADLYNKSLLAYSDLAEERDDVKVYLHYIRQSLKRIKNRLYPEVLRAYESKMEHSEGELSPIDDLHELLALAKGAEIDVVAEFAQVQKTIQLKEYESKIDFAQANREQSQLFNVLSSNNKSQEIADLIKEAKQLKDAKNSQLTQLSLLNNSFTLAREQNIDLGLFPNLQAYVQYLIRFSELKVDLLVEEMDALKNRIYGAMLPDDDLKKIRALDQYTLLLDKAYQIKLSSFEYKVLKANEPIFQTKEWLFFINEKLKQLSYRDDLVSYNNVFDRSSSKIDHFYNLVNQRDNAFLENTQRIFKEKNLNAAFLIAGGYHSENLTKLLREEGYSYIVLTPVVTHETDHEQYERALLTPLNLEKHELNNDKETLVALSNKDQPSIKSAIVKAYARTPLGIAFATRMEEILSPYSLRSLELTILLKELGEPNVRGNPYSSELADLGIVGGRLSNSKDLSPKDLNTLVSSNGLYPMIVKPDSLNSVQVPILSRELEGIKKSKKQFIDSFKAWQAEVVENSGMSKNDKVSSLNQLVESIGITSMTAGQLAMILNQYKDFGAWQELTLFYEQSTNKTFRDSPVIREYYAVALHKNNEIDKSEKVALDLIDDGHANGEIYAILGKIYKIRYASALERFEVSGEAEDWNAAEAAILQSINYLEKGYSTDFEYYPGINLVYNALLVSTLYVSRGESTQNQELIEEGRRIAERAQSIANMVYYSVEKSGGLRSDDFWTLATMLEVAVILNDSEKVERILPYVVNKANVDWEIGAPIANLKTFAQNGSLIDLSESHIQLASTVVERLEKRLNEIQKGIQAEPLTAEQDTRDLVTEKIMGSGFSYGAINSNYVGGNINFGGQLHDHVVNRWDIDVADSILKELGIRETSDFNEFNASVDNMLRSFFGTDTLEDLESTDHDELDVFMQKLLDITGSKKYNNSKTNVMADLLMCEGDCRHHAYAKQLLFDVWKSRNIDRLLSKAYTAARNGSIDEYNQIVEGDELSLLSRTQMLEFDLTVRVPIQKKKKFNAILGYERFYPVKNEDGSFVYDDSGEYFEEEHALNGVVIFDLQGNVESFRLTDSFYQKVYPFGGESIGPDGKAQQGVNISLDEVSQGSFSGVAIQVADGDDTKEVGVSLSPTSFAGSRDKRVKPNFDEYGQLRIRGITVLGLQNNQGHTDVSLFFDDTKRIPLDNFIQKIINHEKAASRLSAAIAPTPIPSSVNDFVSVLAHKDSLKHTLNADIFEMLAAVWDQVESETVRRRIENALGVHGNLIRNRAEALQALKEFQAKKDDNTLVVSATAIGMHNKYDDSVNQGNNYVLYTQDVHDLVLEYVKQGKVVLNPGTSDESILSVENFINANKKHKIKLENLTSDVRDEFRGRLDDLGVANAPVNNKTLVNTVFNRYNELLKINPDSNITDEDVLEQWRDDRQSFIDGLQNDSTAATFKAFEDLELLDRLSSDDPKEVLDALVMILRRINVVWRINNPYNGFFTDPLLSKTFALEEDGGIGIDDILKDAIALQAVLIVVGANLNNIEWQKDGIKERLEKAFQSDAFKQIIQNELVDKTALAETVKNQEIPDTFVVKAVPPSGGRLSAFESFLKLLIFDMLGIESTDVSIWRTISPLPASIKTQNISRLSILKSPIRTFVQQIQISVQAYLNRVKSFLSLLSIREDKYRGTSVWVSLDGLSDQSDLGGEVFAAQLDQLEALSATFLKYGIRVTVGSENSVLSGLAKDRGLEVIELTEVRGSTVVLTDTQVSKLEEEQYQFPEGVRVDVVAFEAVEVDNGEVSSPLLPEIMIVAAEINRLGNGKREKGVLPQIDNTVFSHMIRTTKLTPSEIKSNVDVVTNVNGITPLLIKSANALKYPRIQFNLLELVSQVVMGIRDIATKA